MAGLRDRAAAILTDLQLESTGTLMGDLTAAAASIGVEPAETVIDTLARLEAALTGNGATPAAPAAPDASDAMDAEPAAFDEAEATKAAKKLKVVELRAALEAAGADTKGLKAALVERLVGVQRAAAGGAPPAAPEASDATEAAPEAEEGFDEAAATRQAKKMKVAELRAALEAAGADTKGLKAALVERLVGVQRAAASGKRAAEPSDEAERSPKKSRRA